MGKGLRRKEKGKSIERKGRGLSRVTHTRAHTLSRHTKNLKKKIYIYITASNVRRNPGAGPETEAPTNPKMPVGSNESHNRRTLSLCTRTTDPHCKGIGEERGGGGEPRIRVRPRGPEHPDSQEERGGKEEAQVQLLLSYLQPYASSSSAKSPWGRDTGSKPNVW